MPLTPKKPKRKKTKRDEALRIAGQRLSNAAFNLAQDRRLDERTRQSLREGYQEWDNVISVPLEGKS